MVRTTPPTVSASSVEPSSADSEIYSEPRNGAHVQRKSSYSAVVGFVKEGVNRTRGDMDATKRIRSEIGSAIDESLARHRAVGLDAQRAFESVAGEAVVMAKHAEKLILADKKARAHNEKVGRYGTAISLAGVCCLIVPILLIFDKLTIFLPDDFKEILSMGAQEDTLFGRTTLFTVLVVELASTASLMNSHSSGALCVTCFMTLVTLLGLVRKFARRRGVMSDTHRARALDIVCAIEDHLKLRFVGLKHPKDETSKPDSEASITTGKNIDAVNTE